MLAAVVALYALSIPWYRETGAAPALWGGLPDWVALALGCYVAAAALNAGAWLLADVRDPGSHEGRERRPEGR
jgi:hypothetical protein